MRLLSLCLSRLSCVGSTVGLTVDDRAIEVHPAGLGQVVLMCAVWCAGAIIHPGPHEHEHVSGCCLHLAHSVVDVDSQLCACAHPVARRVTRVTSLFRLTCVCAEVWLLTVGDCKL